MPVLQSTLLMLQWHTGQPGKYRKELLHQGMVSNTDPGISERGEILQSKSPDVSLPPQVTGRADKPGQAQAYHGNPLC